MPVLSRRSNRSLSHLIQPEWAYKKVGAGNEIRTRDTKLGKLVLYQLSYARNP